MSRVLLIDLNHVLWNYFYALPSDDVVPLIIDERHYTAHKLLVTTILKCIFRWSNEGEYPVAVCIDAPKCDSTRVSFFDKWGIDYTPTRGEHIYSFNHDIDTITEMLRKAGAQVFRSSLYTGADFVCSCVNAIKANPSYAGSAIDIVTGDVALLPLVDSRTSVFLHSKKSTWAESKSLEKKHYIQVAPANFEKTTGGLTFFSKLSVPYNTVLLSLILRGDKTHSMRGLGFTPSKYNALLQELLANSAQVVTCYSQPVLGSDGLYQVPHGFIDAFLPLRTCLSKDLLHTALLIYLGYNLGGPLNGTVSRGLLTVNNPVSCMHGSLLSDMLSKFHC